MNWSGTEVSLGENNGKKNDESELFARSAL